MAKPKFLDAFVLFASMMQRYEFFSTYARKIAIFLENFYAEVTHLLTYSLRTLMFFTSTSVFKEETLIIIYNINIIYYYKI